MKRALLIGSILVLASIFVACAAAPQKQDAADMTGTWQLQVVSPSGSGTPTFELNQQGAALTGKYAGAFGEAPVTGIVRGNAFEIRFVSMGANIVYEGTVDGSNIKGDVDFGGQAEGTFTGRRQ